MFKNYSLHEPLFEQNVRREVSKCIETGWLSSTGKNVELFEKKNLTF